MNVVFLNIGPETETAAMMVRSIRAHNPDLRIIQLTDAISPAVPGVDQMHRVDGDSAKIMAFRVLCFSQIDVTDPTWFLDTDMLCLAPLPVLGESSVGICRREFGVQAIFNHQFRGLDFSRYQGMTLGAVYPFLACATFVWQSDFWRRCLDCFPSLPPQFHYWYGDQETIRHIVDADRESFMMLPECIYACPHDCEIPGMPPKLLHFKGKKAKPLMRSRAESHFTYTTQ